MKQIASVVVANADKVVVINTVDAAMSKTAENLNDIASNLPMLHSKANKPRSFS